MSSDATFPPTILTAQQRAARVTAAFYQSKTIHVRDVMRLTGLTRRGALDLLDNLSSCGGIPIVPVGDGKWQLITAQFDGAPAFVERPTKIHPNTRAMIAFALAQGGQMETSEIAKYVGLAAADVRWLLQLLRVGGLPIEEVGLDTWQSVKPRNKGE